MRSVRHYSLFRAFVIERQIVFQQPTAKSQIAEEISKKVVAITLISRHEAMI